MRRPVQLDGFLDRKIAIDRSDLTVAAFHADWAERALGYAARILASPETRPGDRNFTLEVEELVNDAERANAAYLRAAEEARKRATLLLEGLSEGALHRFIWDE